MSNATTGSSRDTRSTAKSTKSTKSANPKPSTSKRAPSKTATRTSPPRTSGPGSKVARPTHSFWSRHRVVTALIPVVVIVALIATMIVIKATSHSGTPSTGTTAVQATDPLSHRVAASLSVPAATLEAVGGPSTVVPPTKVNGASVLRAADGKPIVTYIGAEYCPYCAAQRWALAVALSRFGTFSNLSATSSSASDVYPNTQTLSFYKSKYSSPYIDFQPVEETTNQLVNGSYSPLQTPTAAQRGLLSKYDVAPYTSTPGSIPFLDVANKFVASGASYSPQLLQGYSRDQISAQLSDPNSPVAQAIDGSANNITAAICVATGNQPSSVCNSPAIAAIVKKLGG